MDINEWIDFEHNVSHVKTKHNWKTRAQNECNRAATFN